MLSKHVALIVSISLIQTTFPNVSALAQGHSSGVRDLSHLDRTSLITADQAGNIYRHLVETHWVPETGLFLSYPDSLDHKLSQQASTYEQGAVGLLALRVGDLGRAKGLYEFLRTTWESEPRKGDRNGMHGLSNFYNAEFGTAGIERTVHLGPNAWAGLFVARFANETHSAEALQLALDIQYWVANALPHENGAVAMGPRDDASGAPWAHIFSTENNLSYYAMLTELLRSPKIEPLQRSAITTERDHLENWLLSTAVDRGTLRLKRGINPKGIDTIAALDTVTWFISAIGPKRLAQRGINPRRLMDKSAEAFEVTVAGRLGVDSSDQAEANFIFAHDHNGGGRPAGDSHRLIWYEGLGQYILALSHVAEYYAREGDMPVSRRLLAKAKALTQEFDMASLPNYLNASAFPYATPGRFYRDGWQTQADGQDGPASSLIASTWRCFAGLGYDPVAGRELSSVQSVRVNVPTKIAVAHRPPAILYGTSEEMLNQSWRALESKNYATAIEQAKATVQEWSSWALKLQDKKQREVGRLLPYNGLPQEQRAIFNYWALNDVGAAYFIIGKAYDEQGDYANAAKAFQQIVNHYSLAQVWDPQGWFWSPIEAVSNDYVLRSPEHYSNVMPQLLAEGSYVGKNPN